MSDEKISQFWLIFGGVNFIIIFGAWIDGVLTKYWSIFLQITQLFYETKQTNDDSQLLVVFVFKSMLVVLVIFPISIDKT